MPTHLLDPAPPLRRLPVPATAPRSAVRVISDHRADGVPGQGALSLDSAGPVERPAAHRAPRGQAALAAFCARTPTSGQALPDPRRWAGQFVQAAVEVSAGYRPVSQLSRWTSEEVYSGVTRRARLSSRTEPRVITRRLAPPPARVQSVRICSPADGVVEACAVVRDRERTRAVALRMEGLDGRWRVTALEIG